MAQSPICEFGWQAPDFTLPATDGKTYSLADIAGPKGALIMFICNHCPYVQAIQDKLTRDAADLQALGIGVAGICANDATTHPSDGIEGMTAQAASAGFPFPYLRDESQAVARAYDAVCT
ncbi:MAG: thioredoxin family protein, partial [Pseudomonadota bacterium]